MFNMLTAAVTLALLGMPVAGQAEAEDTVVTVEVQPVLTAAFVLRNDGDKTIETLLYGQSASDEWSDNVLDAAVRPHGAVEITFHDRLTGCEFDLYYVFTDGSDDVERVDVCALNGHVHRFGAERAEP